MKRFILILTAGLAVSCSGTAGTDMPEWRWEDKEKPAFVEPHPTITDQGWTNVTGNYSTLPEGVDIYRSPETLNGNKVIAYIAVADLSKVAWDVKSIDDPTIQGTSDPLKTPAQYYQETSAPVIVNGGYFFVDGGKRYNASVAVSGGRTYGVNVNYASADWVTVYYPTRGVFYEKDGVRATGWTYWSGGVKHYLYEVPARNSWSKAPLQVPDASFPATAADFAPETAIGGGPVLLKGGKVENTWEAEMFYGDGSDDKMPEARHPRTAIGVTKDGYLVLFVCEGRGMTDGVAGMTFAEEAAALQALGCVEALNLDGGGSSCLLVEGKETIKVSDGSQRAVGSVVLLKKR